MVIVYVLGELWLEKKIWIPLAWKQLLWCNRLHLRGDLDGQIHFSKKPWKDHRGFSASSVPDGYQRVWQGPGIHHTKYLCCSLTSGKNGALWTSWGRFISWGMLKLGFKRTQWNRLKENLQQVSPMEWIFTVLCHKASTWSSTPGMSCYLPKLNKLWVMWQTWYILRAMGIDLSPTGKCLKAGGGQEKIERRLMEKNRIY